ncbi:MAG: cell division protein FtsZ, partial [Bacteroidales bacterium]|nr:cell division protein FtsZ [Bacteroidales bacterium]
MKAFEDDLIQFEIQKHRSSIIKVIGVGGGGGNAVNHMFRQGIKDVDFVVCNTDAQALANSPVPVKVQLGSSLTEGRGAGNKPDIGRQAAIENLQDIIDILAHNTKMVFITAGMGGGTGTGAAPVIAKAAKEMGILTVAIVTVPFRFEGQLRINQAIDGINELEKYVDSLLVIHNEKLREIYGNLKISEAFAKADDVLTIAAKGIAEIITVHGYVNVDFADVQTVMSNSGVAILGSARARGENRALDAIQQAINSPLLNNNDIRGAKSILLNITSGEDEVSMDEVGVITDYVTNAVAKDALLI